VLADRSRLGLLGVVVGFLGLASVYAFSVPGFTPADETSHVGQAYLVAEGKLPTLDTATPDVVPGMALYFPTRRRLYTANHPPLYYAVAGVPIRLGVEAERPLLGFVAARVLTAAIASLAAVATWRMASVLLPGRRELHVLAAALVLLVPMVPMTAGTVYNDGFGLAGFAVLLALCVEVLVRGPRTRTLLLLGGAAVVVGLTRTIGLGGVAIAAGVAATSILVHHRGALGRRLLVGGAWAAGVLGAVGLTSGWFWVRNERRYGDLAGSAYNLEQFGYVRKGSTFEFLTALDPILTVHRRTWGRMYDVRDFATGWGIWPGLLIVAVVLVGAVLLVARMVRRRATGLPDPAIPPATEVGPRLAWLLLGGWWAAVWISVMSYQASGGGLHPRYLFPCLPAVAVLAAAAIGAWPGRRRGVLPALLIAPLVAIGLQHAARFADLIGPAGASWSSAIVENAYASNAVAGVFVWSAVLLAVAGTALACWSTVSLARAPVPAEAQQHEAGDDADELEPALVDEERQ